jgi:putative transposase
MKNFALSEDKNPSDISAHSALEAVLRDGARKMLQEAIENEVLEYIQQASLLRDEKNRRLVIRNGSLPLRNIATGMGPIPVEQPRIRDRRAGHSFSSAIEYRTS